MGYEAHSGYENTNFGLGKRPRRDPRKKSTRILYGWSKVLGNFYTRDLGEWCLCVGRVCRLDGGDDPSRHP